MTVLDVIKKWRDGGASRPQILKRLIEDGYDKTEAQKLINTEEDTR